MRLTYIHSVWCVVSLAASFDLNAAWQVQRRQLGGNSGLPTLSSTSIATSVASASGSSAMASMTAASMTAIISSQGASSNSTTSQTEPTSSVVSSSLTQSVATTATTTSTAASNTTISSDQAVPVALPLPPRITPALSLGGAIMIITGVVYALIGIKNRWIHIFLSTAYLTSLSICVLIVYVINPPVSNAVQGAYFVGIFMTGVIFGGGSLIFKEVTEGLGCLLGGFTLAMWFLTLKEGGLITNDTGKAIFITIFCVLAWSLSFSHHTRNYGLIGSTSFSGSTVLVLGIDCFSKGGLKEFWLYIWDLNPNLFPLNTNTYPITRGTRVETIVIILGCIIGVISQLKIWKVVKDRQKRKQEAAQDEERRREVVEAALGKHLQRQNDRDRAQWEKQYGDRLHAKRDTILWTDTIGEKNRYSRIAETDIGHNRAYMAGDGVEMDHMPRQPRSVYVGRIKRQSGMPINSIAEDDEPISRNVTPFQNEEQQKSLAKLEGKDENDQETVNFGGQITGSKCSSSPSPDAQPQTVREAPVDHNTLRPNSQIMQRGTSAEEARKSKRLSWTSIFSKSGRHDGSSPKISPSQEELNAPRSASRLSRASSLAATLDFENESLDDRVLYPPSTDGSRPPEIVISPDPSNDAATAFLAERDASYRAVDAPPSPPALTENFDFDFEELVRPATAHQLALPIVSMGGMKKELSAKSVHSVVDPMSKEKALSTTSSETASKEVLTIGALKDVPNHLSHVVLSYRTNEWAKHISTAEAPMYEEPEAGEDEASEPVAHLALPEELSGSMPIAEPPPLSITTTMPESASRVEAAVSSPTQGVRINPARQAIRPSSATTRPELAPKSNSATNIQNANIPRGLRSSSTPMLKQYHTSVVSDENLSGHIDQRRSLLRSASGLPYIQAAGNFSSSQLSQMSGYAGAPARTFSQLSTNRSIPILTETRMQSYDSHQPPRRDTLTEAQRRDVTLAGWRTSRNQNTEPKDTTEEYRMQMKMQRQQEKALEEQQKAMKLQHDMAVDMRMRSRDMQELHKEAMRRMQASANKSLAP